MARRKRGGEQGFKLDSFCDPGNPAHFVGSFQENLRALLMFGHPEAVGGEVQCHSFQLELHHGNSPTSVRLLVLEEDVEKSAYHRCHYCRSAGWSHHIICSKRFHFVLPKRDSSSQVQNVRHYVSTEWLKKASSGTKPVTSTSCYLMHGVVHSNGFGHLLDINGIEGGSHFLSGRQIMDLWDRICTALQARKISLIDFSTKAKMELRLLHGVAGGEPWFSRWGYKFAHGSYGVTRATYQHSLRALQALPLCLLNHKEIPAIISKYQSLCNHKLLTLSNLFRFLLQLKTCLPPSPAVAVDYSSIMAESACRWSPKRVEMAAQVIVEKLKSSESKWVTRQEIRDAARAFIGDTGLLDFVLKTLGNHAVGSYIVRRAVNPLTRVLEYSLEEVSNVFQLTKVQLLADMLYLYEHVLRDPSSTVVSALAVRMVLDVKHLAKEYQHRGLPPGDGDMIRLTCCIRVRRGHWQIGVKGGAPPVEVVSVAATATVGELKREVEKHFRGMCLGLGSFVAESIAELEGVRDWELVSEALELGRRLVVVEGRVEEGRSGEMYEGGVSGGRAVDCGCGAKEDDGERMVCCDVCDVWEHTRCAGMGEEEEALPPVFLCRRCESDMLALPAIQ